MDNGHWSFFFFSGFLVPFCRPAGLVAPHQIQRFPQKIILKCWGGVNIGCFPMEPFLVTLQGPLVPISRY